MKILKNSLPHDSHTKIAMFLFATLSFVPQLAAAISFSQLNLVTDDQSANPAQITDPALVNAWGLSYSPTGPFWVSDNGTHVSTIYNVNPATNITTKAGLTVTIPGAGNVTGQVFNSNSANAFNQDLFLFVSEDGTISGWRSNLGTSAETLATGSSANIYKGVAEAAVSGNNYLYAANFKSGTIDVFKGTSTGLGTSDLAGSFTDPNLPNGYAPFNIQNLNDKLYVTYAEQDPNSPDEVAGAGKGLVSIFDTQGNFIERLASQGTLNAPWGLAIAPSSFGEFAGDLLVGNFGDGTINAFNLTNNHFDGQLKGSNRQPLSIDGLWALTLGNGGNAGSSQSIYFSAGPNEEAHGLFGAIAVVPIPSALWLFGSALVGVNVFGRRPRTA